MARPADSHVSFFFCTSWVIFQDLAIVKHSHRVVVRLPREVLFGVRVDASCKRRVWEFNFVHCDRPRGFSG